MAHPLLLLGAISVTNIFGGSWLNSAAMEAEDMKPKLLGMDARPLLVGLGVLGTLLFPPVLAFASAGLGLAAIVNWDATAKFKTALETAVEAVARNQALEPPVEIPSHGYPQLPSHDEFEGDEMAPEWVNQVFESEAA